MRVRACAARRRRARRGARGVPRPAAAATRRAPGRCDSCRDLHTIASALQDDQAEALAEARVPSAGQAWWRAELRARQEAAAVADRPITVATGLAAASLVGLLASVAGVLGWWLQDWLGMPAALQSVAAGLENAA